MFANKILRKVCIPNKNELGLSKQFRYDIKRNFAIYTGNLVLLEQAIKIGWGRQGMRTEFLW